MDFLVILLSKLDASLFGSILTGKGVIRGGEGLIRTCEGVIRSRSEFLMLPNLLTNFGIQKYYQNKPKSNGVNARNNSLKIKDGEHITTMQL